MMRVIYTNNSCGMVKEHLLDGLIARGEIVAFHGLNGWVDVRCYPIPVTEAVAAGKERKKPKKRPGNQISADKHSLGYAGED